MRKKGIILLVVLLAVASLMAAMAYNTAYVQSPTALKIASSDQALLSIIPGTGVGNKDVTSYIETTGYDVGVMKLAFGKGIGGQMYGLQPGSEYVWNNLFSVKNNSAEDLTYRITIGTPGGYDLMKHIEITDVTANQVVFARDCANATPYISLPSNSSHTFKVSIWTHSYTLFYNPTKDLTGTLQFNVEAK